MPDEAQVLAAEREFFTGLTNGDLEKLEAVLDDDFVLIDLNGSNVGKQALKMAVESGQLHFDSIEPADPVVRLYGETAIVTGRTRMQGHLGEIAFNLPSRYTHVYVAVDGRVRLASAQGTQIVQD